MNIHDLNKSWVRDDEMPIKGAKWRWRYEDRGGGRAWPRPERVVNQIPHTSLLNVHESSPEAVAALVLRRGQKQKKKTK